MKKKYHNKKQIKLKIVILAAFIVGILISIYLKSQGDAQTYITIEEKREIENNIELTKKEIEQLKENVSEYKITLKKYKSIFNDENKSVKELLSEELDYLKKVSGFSKMTGSGVVITIKDSEKDLNINQNPNDLIVHDIDILRIVNDLKKSGAIAISINGERVLPTSKIKCSGATITVNDTTYGQPFIIRAIGNSQALIAQMISPESYATLLKEVYGIYIEVESKNEVIISSYEKN